jgi:peroxiredoxin
MLHDELAAFQAEWTEKATSERRSLYEKAIEDLRRSGFPERALGVGALAPDFELPDARGGTIRLADFLDGGRAVVLAFYRGGWCPYCSIQLRACQRALADIRRLRGELVAVSPEKPDSSLSTAEKNRLAFPVLSDVGQRAAESFGIVYSLLPTSAPPTRRTGSTLLRRTAKTTGAFPCLPPS